MANPFNLGLFKGPRYSAFPISHDNKISMSAGKLTPIYWDFLNTGDKIEADVADVVRLAPMVVPTLDTYKVDIHAFALRLRSLGNAGRDPWVYEDFFNLNKNTDGSRSLPSLPLGLLFSINGFKTGTLLESLGIPTLKASREEYLNFLRSNFAWVFDPVLRFTMMWDTTGLEVDSIGFYPSSLPTTDIDVLPEGVEVNVPFNAVKWADIVGNFKFTDDVTPYYLTHVIESANRNFPFKRTLVSYIIDKFPAVLKVGDDIVASNNGIGYALFSDPAYAVPRWELLDGVNLLDRVYELYKIDSISVLKDYTDDLLDGFLSLTSNGLVDDSSAYSKLYGHSDEYSVFHRFHLMLAQFYTDLPYISISGIPDRLIPAYPFEAYSKIISDWYINTAIDDPDSFFASRSFLYYWGLFNSSEMTADALRAKFIELNELFNRYWQNDYFTSAFPSPQAGQAVGIPVNGTIVDLRNANAMQKLKERLLYAGSRFRDVLFAITGKKTSAAILEMSEVLGSWSNIINVDAVLQQSETKNDSPQAGYAGTGLGYRAGGKDFKYTAEEPTIIMVFASIVPQASYFQGLSRKFTRGNVYDYAIPQLANVGEQEILTRELFVSLDNIGATPTNGVTFGYTRRNGDWMWTPNEVHGDFQGSLDMWHNARIFGSVPSLSRNFMQVNPAEDNLNRVFAVDSDSYDHFYCNFSFMGHIIRSLPKHVHYDL